MTAAPKSPLAALGERPNARTHVESVRVSQTVIRPKPPVVVDDLMTKGATILAAAAAYLVSTQTPGFPALRLQRRLPPSSARSSRVFIENGRVHGATVVKTLVARDAAEA